MLVLDQLAQPFKLAVAFIDRLHMPTNLLFRSAGETQCLKHFLQAFTFHQHHVHDVFNGAVGVATSHVQSPISLSCRRAAVRSVVRNVQTDASSGAQA